MLSQLWTAALLPFVVTASALSNRTLLMISHEGASLAASKVPGMMAQAVGVERRLRFLSQADLQTERCFNEGMVEELTAVGVQVVSEKCSATPSQIRSYLEKCRSLLGITVECEADSEVSVEPTVGRRASTVTACSGSNRRLGTNDPMSSCQSNLEVIRAARAWEATRSSNRTLRDVVLAIVDSGVDTTHPDLVDQFWKSPLDGSIGYNFLAGNTDVRDNDGHGTHCAGIAGAQTNNGIGIAGVANVKLMILKFLGTDGRGQLSGALQALDFAVRMGADVSSHSYTSPSFSKVFETAIARAGATGHVVVAASGNDGLDLDQSPSYPCSYSKTQPTVICVAASMKSAASVTSVARFSNVGSPVTIAAPGVGILSTYLNGNYVYLSGTSMATPHVAGVTAEVAKLGLAGETLVNTIKESQNGNLKAAGASSFGELDALNAVLVGLGQPTSPPRSAANRVLPGLLLAFILYLNMT